MAIEVILPRVDMDMAHGQIIRCFLNDGEKVSKGQPLFEIETDKAALEIEAPASGLLRQLAPINQQIPVGQVVAWIVADGESFKPAARMKLPPKAEKVSEQIAAKSAESNPIAQSTNSEMRATPLARRFAKENGIALASVVGSGPHGRIVM